MFLCIYTWRHGQYNFTIRLETRHGHVKVKTDFHFNVKLTSEKKKKVNVLGWPSQSTNLNRVEKLWLDFNRIRILLLTPLGNSVGPVHSPKQPDKELFCKKNGVKLPCLDVPAWLRHIHRLAGVITAKCASTKCWPEGLNISVKPYFTLCIFINLTCLWKSVITLAFTLTTKSKDPPPKKNNNNIISLNIMNIHYFTKPSVSMGIVFMIS